MTAGEIWAAYINRPLSAQLVGLALAFGIGMAASHAKEKIWPRFQSWRRGRKERKKDG